MNTTNTQDPIKLPPLPEPELFTHQTLQPNKDGVMGPSGVHLGVKKRGVCEQAHIDGETDIAVHQWFSGEQLEDYARAAIAALQSAAAQPKGDAREAFEVWAKENHYDVRDAHDPALVDAWNGFQAGAAWQAATAQASEPSFIYTGQTPSELAEAFDGYTHGTAFYTQAAPARAVEPGGDK